MAVTIRDALREGTRLLRAAGSDEASLEAELLLLHVLGLDRVHLYQRLTEEVPPAAYKRYQRLIGRRLSHEPLAYILGHREFFGLDLVVTPAAIIPRPETEVLVELAIAYARSRFGDAPFALADVGVGCGAIAVAIAVNLPNARIFATDVSKRALALARRNAERHGVQERITFLWGDLLRPLEGALVQPEPGPSGGHGANQGLDIIVANLPYVTAADWAASPPEIREHEPRRGLDGGPDGLRLIRRLLGQAPRHLRAGGALFAEIGDNHGPAAASLARAAFPGARIEVKPDLAGFDRVLAVYT
jgi:release factor glutamine methyltransferase